jgi:SAM-dependent methyltransferase
MPRSNASTRSASSGTSPNTSQPAASDLSVVPFLFMHTITDDPFAHGLRTYIKAGFADDLPHGLIDALLDRAARLRSPISQVELLALGGAITGVDPDATSFPFRRARWLINIPATWRDAADDEHEIAWARATYAAVQPFLTKGTYVNFMGDDEDTASAYGRTIERLQQVKAAYDPDNVFRLNQNIQPVTAAAQVQRRLWGTDPRAWADLAEAHNRPLFEAVLDAAGAGPGTCLLDVGCGSGLTLVLAEQLGAVPAGLDISPGLLHVARDRLPGADLREGDMESLPFGEAAFDAVVGVNAFQFAGDPRRALREAARVTRPGGHVVASLFAAPERSQGTVMHEAMNTLIPPEQARHHAPYALSAPGNLEAALTGAGLRLTASAHVPVQTNAKPSPAAGTPATAAAVSCDGPTITCGGRALSQTAGPRSAPAGPATSPAARRRGNIFIGTAASRSSGPGPAARARPGPGHARPSAGTPC